MIRVGAMALSLPEAEDVPERWMRGYYPDGGYWLDVRRLADHDHSGGLLGLRVPSSSTGYWTFSTNPTIADPSPGHVRSDTGALSTATLLVISLTTSEGTEMPGLAGTLGPGDSLYVQDRDDSSRHVRYDVTAPATNATTHLTVPVGVVATAGAEIANNQTVAITFYLTSGGGVGAVDVTITTDASLSSTESPANTFALAVRLSAAAGNILTLQADGLRALVPVAYLTEVEGDARYPLRGDVDPFPQYLTATEADARYPLLTAPDPYPQYTTAAEGDARWLPLAHAPGADPHPQYLTPAEGDVRYRPISYVTDVTVTGDNGVGVTESPANSFALATRVSADSGNILVLRGTGLYAPAAGTDPALEARIAALETSVAALKTHTHELGTWAGGTVPPVGVP